MVIGQRQEIRFGELHVSVMTHGGSTITLSFNRHSFDNSTPYMAVSFHIHSNDIRRLAALLGSQLDGVDLNEFSLPKFSGPEDATNRWLPTAAADEHIDMAAGVGGVAGAAARTDVEEL